MSIPAVLPFRRRATTRATRPTHALVVGGVVAAGLAGAACAEAQPPARRDTIPAGVSVRLSYDPATRPGVAVLPVSGAGGDSIRAILQRDLDYGDRITVLNGAAADAPALPGGRVSWELARRLGALALVQAVPVAGALRVTVHDVARETVLQTRDFPLPAAGTDGWRLAVHAASDEVERWITGVRGVAATRVLYVREGRVWSVDSDGENARPVSGPGALSPAWHPSGSGFVHSTLENDGRMRIVARSFGGGARVLAETPVTNITPELSPDGRTVVFAHGAESGTDLFAVPYEGGPARRVTVGRGTDNVSPSFAPDGRRLAFTSGRSGHPEVYIADADGTGAELLTDYDYGGQNYRSNPDWSPDGRAVAFQSLVGGQFQVLTIALRDRGTRQLTREGRNEDPSWAPDARHLVFTSTRTGTGQLFVVDVETGRTRQLTRGGSAARMGAWSPALAPGP